MPTFSFTRHRFASTSNLMIQHHEESSGHMYVATKYGIVEIAFYSKGRVLFTYYANNYVYQARVQGVKWGWKYTRNQASFIVQILQHLYYQDRVFYGQYPVEVRATSIAVVFDEVIGLKINSLINYPYEA